MATAVVSLIGGIMAFQGAQKQQKALEKSEMAKERQMNLDVQRKKRSALREAQAARQVALANATNQGAQFGSGVAGGFGQIGNQLGGNFLALNQDSQLGADVFSANRQYAKGGAMAAFGTMLTNGAETISRVGKTAFGVA